MPKIGFLRDSTIRCLLAALALALPGCGTSLQPCVAGPPKLMPVDPCIDATDAECKSRLAFVHKAFDSTVRIHVSAYTEEEGVTYSSGTGEIIDERGTVLTAWHVVKNAKLIVAGARKMGKEPPDYINVRDVPMAVIAGSPELDIALLRPDGVGEKLPKPFVVRRDAPKAGEVLWHFGQISYWSHGKVLKTNVEYNGKVGLTEVGFPCRHGDSGGPFVDLQGRLVGVLLQKSSEVEGRGHTFFLPISVALDALDYRP